MANIENSNSNSHPESLWWNENMTPKVVKVVRRMAILAALQPAEVSIGNIIHPTDTNDQQELADSSTPQEQRVFRLGEYPEGGDCLGGYPWRLQFPVPTNQNKDLVASQEPIDHLMSMEGDMESLRRLNTVRDLGD